MKKIKEKIMEKEVCMGETKFKLSDFEKENSKVLYKVASSQQVKNILVYCKYFEGKPNEYTGVKDIDFLVEIKVYSKRPNDPLHWYEIHSNGNDCGYDHINCYMDSVERELPRGTKEAEKFDETIRFINENFDDFTVKFVNCALQNIDSPKIYTTTPQFIKNVIEDIRKVDNIHGL